MFTQKNYFRDYYYDYDYDHDYYSSLFLFSQEIILRIYFIRAIDGFCGTNFQIDHSPKPKEHTPSQILAVQVQGKQSADTDAH